MHEEKRLQMVSFSRQTHAETVGYVCMCECERVEASEKRDQEFNIRANDEVATVMFTFPQLN